MKGFLHVCRSRVARLDNNGVPLPGANNLYVSDALMTVSINPVIETGDEVSLKTGCGDLAINVKEEDRYKWHTIEANWATFDPYLHELLVGGRILDNGAGPDGYAYPRLGTEPSPNGVSWEFWVHRASGAGIDPDYPYARWVLPKVKLTMGNRAHGNSAAENPMSGFGFENPNFHDGPNNDWPTDIEESAAWIPVAASDVPDAVDAYQSLPAS